MKLDMKEYRVRRRLGLTDIWQQFYVFVLSRIKIFSVELIESATFSSASHILYVTKHWSFPVLGYYLTVRASKE